MSMAQIKPISYLKSHAAQIAQELADGADPLVVTQNGIARLVVMDAAEYERREQTLALLKLLALGEREIEIASEDANFRDVKNFRKIK